jgi:hypothetical protein
VRFTDSVPSTKASAAVATVNVFDFSPAWKVSVPLVAA